MKKEFVIQMNEIFTRKPDLKDEYHDLYEFVSTLKEAQRLEDEIMDLNKKLSELNTDKEEK